MTRSASSGPARVDRATTSPDFVSSDSAISKSERLTRTATLVAVGAMPLPLELPADELRIVLREVAVRRRARLVRYLARSISLDIRRDEP